MFAAVKYMSLKIYTLTELHVKLIFRKLRSQIDGAITSSYFIVRLSHIDNLHVNNPENCYCLFESSKLQYTYR